MTKSKIDIRQGKDVIRIENLNKWFKDVHAVNDLSLSVKEGELFAFLGVNGAGKSTTINIMCGQLSKDSGTVEINGADLDKNLDTVKSSLGVVFQQSVLDMFLSVYDNLESRAALYGIHGKEFKERLGELAKLLDFEDKWRSVQIEQGPKTRGSSVDATPAKSLI